MASDLLSRDAAPMRGPERPPGIGLRLSGVSYSYRESTTGRSVPAVEGIDLEVLPGEFLALVGPSGCGKSTLLHLLAGMLFPERGTVTAGDLPIRGVGPDRVLVQQDGALFPWLDVVGNVGFGPRALGRTLEEVPTLIRELGLAGAEARFPKELSGGMRQRAALARALAVHPSVLLLDEPFAALDALSREHLQGVLEAVWRRDQKTVVLVTHSVEEALRLADRVVVMGPRPTAVRAVFPVEASRPRDVTELGALRRAISAEVRR